jgi:hypothetical protein
MISNQQASFTPMFIITLILMIHKLTAVPGAALSNGVRSRPCHVLAIGGRMLTSILQRQKDGLSMSLIGINS